MHERQLHFILIALIACVVPAIASCSDRASRVLDNGSLETVVDSEVRKAFRKGISHGLVVGIYKDGKTTIRGYGHISAETQAAPTGATLFQIGSITKVFTASLLQVLSDEHKVSMDATLEELIGNKVALSPAAKIVTLRQLATHTSGFPDIPASIERRVTQIVGKKDLMRDPYRLANPAEMFAYLQTTVGKKRPGRFEYSNYGIGLLGHVLERVTGETYEHLLSARLLAPLGMTESMITLPPLPTAQLAQGYSADGVPNPPWSFGALASAGAVFSTVDDMMKFVGANFGDALPLTAALAAMRARQPEGSTGIGWMQPTTLDRLFGNNNIVWHNGMTGGYASYISIDATAKTGVVILASEARDATMLGMMLTRQVRTRSWAH